MFFQRKWPHIMKRSVEGELKRSVEGEYTHTPVGQEATPPNSSLSLL
jgi:hypothetical protein